MPEQHLLEKLNTSVKKLKKVLTKEEEIKKELEETPEEELETKPEEK